MNKPTVKRSTTDVSKVTKFIMGVRKFGKTTLWADYIQEKHGNPEYGVLVSCGMEHGTNMIDNINTTHVNTYKELSELKDWLIKEKGHEHKIVEVCFDSAEELFSIFEKETVRRSNIENPKKQCKSIKAAYSGFTNGEKECAKLVKEFLNDLYNAGIIPSAIGHTKMKTVRDKASLDEDGFQKLGSSLIADYEAAIADCFDIVATGLIDREIEERGDGDNVKRYVKETERRLYFRGNEIVEAGGRLKDLSIPEYINFDKPNMAKDFIKTIENALKAGRVDSKVVKTAPAPTPVADEAPFEEETPNFEADLEEADSTEETIDKDTIRVMFKECKDAAKKKEVKTIINSFGKLDDVDNEGLTAIYNVLNN